MTFRVSAALRKMAGRPLNNAVLALGDRAFRRTRAVVREGDGVLSLKIPRAISEASPFSGPAPLPNMFPVPGLPGDTYVTAAFLDGALPAAERVLRALLGPQADSAEFRTSLSLPMLLTRNQLANHLPRAIGGRKLTLAENLIVPGHSSDRVTLTLAGELTDLHVVAPLSGTGTGRYAKDLSSTSTSGTAERWRPILSGGVADGGPMRVLDRDNPSAPYGSHHGDGSTGFTRQTSANQTGGIANNPRREQHVKQQGPVYLIRVQGRFTLAGTLTRHHLLSPREEIGSATSAPVTGEVYLEMFAEDVAALWTAIEKADAVVGTADPGSWPSLDRDVPRLDLDARMARMAGTAGMAAAQIRQRLALDLLAEIGAGTGLILSADARPRPAAAPAAAPGAAPAAALGAAPAEPGSTAAARRSPAVRPPPRPCCPARRRSTWAGWPACCPRQVSGSRRSRRTPRGARYCTGSSRRTRPTGTPPDGSIPARIPAPGRGPAGRPSSTSTGT
ncbi:hypothetical protein [Plantactinospora sp. KBS50]|uniref:hypothetical protein n=1 Tax=Plantactinospora sp. KBS50 TaxID=2024580 RepID=UPI000BAADCDC|nr:hypothetical protein [Plantactinospora sp. KBS50]ASW55411.1 hypothetical protein CIK06_16400 [Plantactinospora sp. KBS50]